MRVRFVLVEPKVPENIGASARAIKTMGFDTLVLVNPVEWKDGKSKTVAHGSYDILEKANVFNSLAEALKDSDFSVATSARERKIRKDKISSEDLFNFLLARSEHINNVSIVFGREESGLTNDEMKLCDIVSSVPMKNKFPSLNLAQAVMIYAYTLSGINNINKNHNQLISEPVNEDKWSSLKMKVKSILPEIGLGENDLRHGRIIERIAFLKGTDLNLAHTICNLLIEKLKGKV